MKTNILVTGAAGNIGRSLVDKLTTFPEYYIVAVDNVLPGHKSTMYRTGSQTRTFCHTVSFLQQNHCINDVMNIGNDLEITVKELAYKVIDITGSSSKIEFLPALPEGDMTRRKPDNTRMRFILGRPLISLEDGLKRTLENGAIV